MPVLPELVPMLERINQARAHAPDASVSVADRRAFVHSGMAQRLASVAIPPPDVARMDYRIPVDAGDPGEIAVRVYGPTTDSTALPGHVYVHGGGWWLGTLEHRDAVCGWRAANVGCVVISVAHRLAPEHRYPVPVYDVDTALRWVLANAAELGVDPARLSIGGDSSGGNLAAAATLLARDRSAPALLAQVLEIPALDLTMSQPSVEENATGYQLTKADLAENIATYCDPERRTEPYASPALAADLTGSPPSLIMTAEYDVVRDDGELYGRRLAEAGVPAEVIRWDGHVHGSHEMTAVLPSARQWQETVESFLRSRLGSG